MPSSYLLVRGSKNDLNSTYACVANDNVPNRYTILQMEEDRVVDRQVYGAARRKELEGFLEEVARDNVVEVDTRESSDLLPFDAPSNAKPADLGLYRRAKSDREIEELDKLSALTFKQIQLTEKESEFRGAMNDDDLGKLKTAYSVTKKPGFVEYRGGFKSATGLVTELSRIEPRTTEWRERMDRVYAGLDAVEREMQVGSTVADLNQTFMKHVNNQKDRVYGNVLHSTGYDAYEEEVKIEEIRPYDYLTLGIVVGDGKNAAVVYRSTHTFEEPVVDEPEEMPEPEEPVAREESPVYQRAPSPVIEPVFDEFVPLLV